MTPQRHPINDRYGDTVTVYEVDRHVVVLTEQKAYGNAMISTVVFSPKQSRKLRKAIKAAEQAAKR